MRFLIGILAVLAVSGCTTDPNDAVRTARKAGFSDVTPGGVDWFACSEDDLEGRKFTGTNAKGEVVQGVVCCGFWFKNCTVRF